MRLPKKEMLICYVIFIYYLFAPGKCRFVMNLISGIFGIRVDDEVCAYKYIHASVVYDFRMCYIMSYFYMLDELFHGMPPQLSYT